MITLTLRGDQIGEALQFDPSGLTTNVEIGRVWFSATDTVTLTLAPARWTGDRRGRRRGGHGSGAERHHRRCRVTTFAQPTNPLDIDPDQSKQGPNFFYVSESPRAGHGGRLCRRPAGEDRHLGHAPGCRDDGALFQRRRALPACPSCSRRRR